MSHPPIRPWYAGRTFPADDVVAVFDEDPQPKILYDQRDAGGTEGAYADIMRGIYGKMDSLKRNQNDFRTWTDEDGYLTFYNAMLDFCGSETRDRVQVLQKLGDFKFRAGAGPDEKKKLISDCFAEATDQEDPRMIATSRSRRLSQIWAPTTDSILDYIVGRPAQAGRVLSDRLNPTNTEPLQLIGHPFKDVRSTTLQPVADARVIAFERGSEIHVIPGVSKTLTNWDADTASVGGVEQVNLFETLLLHELVELVSREENPELPPLLTHIVASTFERYLKADLLSVAVEDFFLDWPVLSEAEETERYEAQLKIELEEASAMFAEEDIPESFDEDDDHLPVDSDGKVPVKKKKKKKVVKKKIVKKVAKKKKE
ncbi:MAG: hypothetical protein HOM68_07350 [Gemmatimonadetes bacterium]|nr:hypothetical protein [Gemmatimonadota bacterium]MBT4611871.1 hypothetical protein [Gemmatimonadota bacterium]MBT5056339.1 hypothetical protein [Gemmatimonadota bacterium]MBT5145109.1 hypothetical protein [Gemmatimonadota bacterium]MBT5586923.1 hypothetical protein [Gemmatimonadota bacterium]